MEKHEARYRLYSLFKGKLEKGIDEIDPRKLPDFQTVADSLFEDAFDSSDANLKAGYGECYLAITHAYENLHKKDLAREVLEVAEETFDEIPYPKPE